MHLHQVCSLLVNNLDRLDESVKEEAEGVHNTLYVIFSFSEMTAVRPLEGIAPHVQRANPQQLRTCMAAKQYCQKPHANLRSWWR